LDLGFPLKISEVTLIILIVLYLGLHQFKIENLGSTKILLLLFGWMTLSVGINLFWRYDYPLTVFASRFGYAFDSITKLVYFLLSVCAYFVSTKLFYTNERKAIKLILIGGLISSIYGWYLFASGVLGYPEFLLPGIKKPQTIITSLGVLIRSSTFGEGNYMGLFIILCSVLSFYTKRTKLAIYFLISLIPTFSSIGFLCAAVFLMLHSFKKYFTKKHLPIIVGNVVLFSVGFILLLNQEDFNNFFIAKFNFFSSAPSGSGDGSRMDRLNTFLSGIEMGLDNSLLGVGLSNYARHYEHYSRIVVIDYTGFKTIANNIYAEVFAETGFVGLVLFLIFLWYLFNAAKTEPTGILKNGLRVCLLYFMAYPTVTILYIWVYFGLIIAVYKKTREASNH